VPEAALFATLCTFIPGGAIMIVPDAWFPLSGCEPHILALRVRADLGYPENNKGAIGKASSRIAPSQEKDWRILRFRRR